MAAQVDVAEPGAAVTASLVVPSLAVHVLDAGSAVTLAAAVAVGVSAAHV